ncbi:MAG: hypothetical protein R2706_10785 [Acidimicrobiales bacterium]
MPEVAPLPLAGYTPAQIRQSVRDGQIGAIADMTKAGLLSDAGPITEQDVGTLVFMAISANELLEGLAP